MKITKTEKENRMKKYIVTNSTTKKELLKTKDYRQALQAINKLEKRNINTYYTIQVIVQRKDKTMRKIKIVAYVNEIAVEYKTATNIIDAIIKANEYLLVYDNVNIINQLQEKNMEIILLTNIKKQGRIGRVKENEANAKKQEIKERLKRQVNKNVLWF